MNEELKKRTEVDAQGRLRLLQVLEDAGIRVDSLRLSRGGAADGEGVHLEAVVYVTMR